MTRVVLRHILVGSQLHLEVEPARVWLPEVGPLDDQVVELGAISSVVKVDDSRRIVALPGLPPFEHLVEQAGPIVFGVGGPAALRLVILVLDVCVASQAGEFARLLKLALEILPLLNVLGELFVPFLNIVIVKAGRIWHGVHGPLGIVFALFLFISLGLPRAKRLIRFVREPQGVDQRQVQKLVLVLPIQTLKLKVQKTYIVRGALMSLSL